MDKTYPTKVQSEYSFPPFATMVESLFKPGTFNEMVMHSAAGVCGEAGELYKGVQNKDLKNVIEEAGDALFYMQKLLNLFGWTTANLRAAFVMRDEDTLSDSLNFMIESTDLLDLAKKVWVYNHPLDDTKDIRGKLLTSLARCYVFLEQILLDFDTNVPHVIDDNQLKLIGPNGRYRDRVFTEAAAQARADKQGDDA